MKKSPTVPADKVCRALDHLCQDVQKGIVPVPKPEVLTRALLSLFPKEELVPPGSIFSLHTAQVVTWCVEEGRRMMEQGNEKSLWLKRRLSRYM